MNALEEVVEKLPFLDKQLAVVEIGELDFWENRKNIPNLTRDEFYNVIYRIDRTINLKWIKRDSTNGPHGKSGEDSCFKFICEVNYGGIFNIESKWFFVKGYFFDKGNLKGVTIQSFRLEETT
ncbi:MAG: hypothetical protein OHK0056_32520 [Bacteriovoracaceae bacterium]